MFGKKVYHTSDERCFWTRYHKLNLGLVGKFDKRLEVLCGNIAEIRDFWYAVTLSGHANGLTTTEHT